MIRSSFLLYSDWNTSYLLLVIIFLVGKDGLNIYSVGDNMSKKGWCLNVSIFYYWGKRFHLFL
jgi:type III secretory pathway component EscR